MKSLKIVSMAAICALTAEAFPTTMQQWQLSTDRAPSTTTSIGMAMNNQENDTTKTNTKPKNNIFDGIAGIFKNLDDVVDDFVMKRMGAGEQFYGKRKNGPSGNYDGEYNGMGISDHMKIEIARVQREELELRRQRRLEEEEARKSKK
jgi:hypothetical protein